MWCAGWLLQIGYIIIFLLGGVQGLSNPHFVNFWTHISPKLIEVGIEIWHTGGCVGLQLVQEAVLSQRRHTMLRVCSFNTKRPAQSFIISCFGFSIHCVQ